MGDSSEVSQKLGDKGAIEITAKIMVVAIIVLFLVVVFAFFLHLYAKWFVQRRQGDSNAASARRRRRLDFAEDLAAVTRLRLGLDPSVLKSIPVSIFNPKDFPDGLECAVCLCEVSEDEKVRTLPKCDHGFHVDCIDMWFQSHSTCPLCRNPISLPTSTADSESTLENSLQSPPLGENSAAAAVSGYSSESPNFPTNVLFWEDETQVSTLSGPCLEEGHVNSSQQTPVSSSSSSWASTGSRPDGMLAIDIPRQINEEQEAKSPMTTRMRSLQRLWSRNRRGSPRSPSNNDLEQGGRGQT